MNTAISGLLSFCFLEREHLSDLHCVTEVASQLSGSRASNYPSSCNLWRGSTSPKGNEEGQMNIRKSKHSRIPPYFLSLRKNWYYSFSIFTQVSWFIPHKTFFFITFLCSILLLIVDFLFIRLKTIISFQVSKLEASESSLTL